MTLWGFLKCSPMTHGGEPQGNPCPRTSFGFRGVAPGGVGEKLDMFVQCLIWPLPKANLRNDPRDAPASAGGEYTQLGGVRLPEAKTRIFLFNSVMGRPK